MSLSDINIYEWALAIFEALYTFSTELLGLLDSTLLSVVQTFIDGINVVVVNELLALFKELILALGLGDITILSMVFGAVAISIVIGIVKYFVK